MARVRVGTSILFLAVVSGTLLPGCRRDPPGEMSPLLYDKPIAIHVRNENWLDIHVYAMSDTQSRSLGVVSTGTQQVFELPATLQHRTDIRFRAEPIGSNDQFVSERFYIGSGDAVYFTVANALHLSSVVVR
jgi:hypothetical protein